jgi:glycerol-3-phosphate dehydrogenase
MNEEFDILVVGGGAVGSGVALDASMRGLRVAMVEADDFSAGTSGRSTKLIHGGIRYLENAFLHLDYSQFELVREALAERKHMLACAPYMNVPLPIMIPVYWHSWTDIFFLPYSYIGAKVYDFISKMDSPDGTTGVPPSSYINSEEAVYQFPMLEDRNLLGAIVYYDGQMNDTRMGLHLALTATQSGAAIANQMPVSSLTREKESGKLNGATVTDKQTGKKFNIKARCVVNATGPFCDSIRKMDNPEVEPIVRGAAGVHVVLPDHYSPSRMGLIVPKTSDGRVLFFLPWEGGTISGTTDTESELTMEPRATDRDVGFILQEANKYLRDEKSVSIKDVKAAWAGIRPLVVDPSAPVGTGGTKSISRTHVIEVSAVGNLVTIAGGKWTTYRKMAEETVDRVLRDLPHVHEGRAVRAVSTLGKKIIGADRSGVIASSKFDRIQVTLREDFRISKDVAIHLVHNYGTRALQIAEMCKKGSDIFEKKIVQSDGAPRRINVKYPFLEAEVIFAIRHEYALNPIDVIARRTRIAFIDSVAAEKSIDRIVDLMGDELKWSRSKRREEAAITRRWLKTMNMSDEMKQHK